MDDHREARAGVWVLLSLATGLSIGALIWSVEVSLSDSPADADYFWQPIDGLVERRALVSTLALFAITGVSIAVFVLRRRGVKGEPGFVVPGVLAGAFLGALYATLTDPGVGAIIGAGLLLMAAPFVLGGLTVWFVRSLRRYRQVRPQQPA